VVLDVGESVSLFFSLCRLALRVVHYVVFDFERYDKEVKRKVVKYPWAKSVRKEKCFERCSNTVKIHSVVVRLLVIIPTMDSIKSNFTASATYYALSAIE
jgi:hypothetical protein